MKEDKLDLIAHLIADGEKLTASARRFQKAAKSYYSANREYAESLLGSSNRFARCAKQRFDQAQIELEALQSKN